ncbi:DNA photolyase phr1 [Rhizina undulata]
MPPKRKVSTVDGGARKRQTTLTPSLTLSTAAAATIPPQPSAPPASGDGGEDVILRKYYPREISVSRCQAYLSGDLPVPLDVLQSALLFTSSTRSKIHVSSSIIHWFRSDLRINDNRALYQASLKLRAENGDGALVGLYIISPEDFEAHSTSPARIDFILRSLETLKSALSELNIPLCVTTVEKRNEISDKVLELARQWNASHVFANMEYEVDELRRDTALVNRAAEEGVDFCVLHDTCIVPPGKLVTKSSGKQYAVFTPWYRAWLKYVAANREVLMLHPPPAANPPSARKTFYEFFNAKIAGPPAALKKLSKAETDRMKEEFPGGEEAGLERLRDFIEQRITRYKEDRNMPSLNGTSSLSVHFAAGTLSARTAVSKAAEKNKGKLDTGSEGVVSWISEVAWREFYKHVLAGWPFVCMNKPFKPELSSLPWSTSADHFTAWKLGRTGYPLVDAAMRQLNTRKWMHNRLRMVVASFLVKDLHIDWRKGEKYFMKQLIDGDFASNNGGWGWCAGTGVDAMPYFRVFNPTEQGRKWDPKGEFVRTWVEELREVKGGRVWELADAERDRLGYVRQVVDHNEVKGWIAEVVKAAKTEAENGGEKEKL